MLSKDQLSSNRFFLVFVAGLAALAPFAIDGYLPTMPDMAASLNTNMAAANLTISAFMLGMAIGQFFGGPLSDQLGRKTIGLAGLIIFIVSSIAIIFAGNIETVQVLRITQAIGGGFASVVCMAQARDVFAPQVVVKKFANIILVVLIAPMIAPTIGALLSGFGWRAVFWFLTIYGLLMVTLYLTLVPETNDDRTGKLDLVSMFRGYAAAIVNRTNGRLISLRYAMFSGFSSGILFCYVTNATFIFTDHFSLSKFEFAAAFGIMGFMLMVGNRITSRLLNSYSPPQILSWANLIQLSMTGGLVILCAATDPALWQIMLGLALLVASSGMISPAASGYFISLYSKNIGSASSLNASMMFAFGSVVGGFAAVLSHGDLLPIFIVMFACSLLAKLILWSAKQPITVNN